MYTITLKYEKKNKLKFFTVQNRENTTKPKSKGRLNQKTYKQKN